MSINILECWFSKIFTCVKWGDKRSSFVALLCGIRQGGVASPTLFAVYINDVLIKLQKSGLGCHIRNLCLNALMYADDLLLISISIVDMQQMIDICKYEFDWLDMKCNVKISGCIRLGNRFNVSPVELSIDNSFISWLSELDYLGLVIKSGRVFRCNMHSIKVKFDRSLNGILIN